MRTKDEFRKPFNLDTKKKFNRHSSEKVGNNR